MASRRDAILALSDARLLAECQVHTFRSPGPGGRKRDTTDSAVRLVHRPTGVAVVARESRSQHENRRRALRRLRTAVAFSVREPPPPEPGPALRRAVADPAWPRLSPRSPDYLPAAAEVLDRLAASGGRLREVAEAVGVATAALVKFLARDNDLWEAAGRIRRAHGLRPLKKPGA